MLAAAASDLTFSPTIATGLFAFALLLGGICIVAMLVRAAAALIFRVSLLTIILSLLLAAASYSSTAAKSQPKTRSLVVAQPTALPDSALWGATALCFLCGVAGLAISRARR